jgi:Recombination endonuclease VII
VSHRDKPKTCKDCLKEHSDAVALWNVRYPQGKVMALDPDEPKLPKRPAIHPGPRCVTHHRAWVRLKRAEKHGYETAKRYGLSPEDYQRILEFQGKRCYICQRATGRSKRLAVDHNHKTGLVRGLLCSVCNHMLAHARDDPEFFERAAFYLRHTPAKMLGIEAIFQGDT